MQRKGLAIAWSLRRGHVGASLVSAWSPAKDCTATPSHVLRSALSCAHWTGGECLAYAWHSSAYTGAKAKRMLSSTSEQTGEHKANVLHDQRMAGANAWRRSTGSTP